MKPPLEESLEAQVHRDAYAYTSNLVAAYAVGKMKSRFFFITYAAANLSLVLYGALTLVTPGILFEPFSLHVYEFPKDAARAAAYLTALFRLLGFFNLVLGALGLLLLRRFRLAPQTWPLRIVVVSTALAYLGPIVFDNTVGSIGFFEVVEHILFALVIILGVVMLSDRGAIKQPGDLVARE